jgi:hypothetical protein
MPVDGINGFKRIEMLVPGKLLTQRHNPALLRTLESLNVLDISWNLDQYRCSAMASGFAISNDLCR